MAWLTSKINWAQIVGVGAIAASWFGFDLTPEVQAQVVTAIAAVTAAATGVLRTFFNKPAA